MTPGPLHAAGASVEIGTATLTPDDDALAPWNEGGAQHHLCRSHSPETEGEQAGYREDQGLDGGLFAMDRGWLTCVQSQGTAGDSTWTRDTNPKTRQQNTKRKGVT